MNYNTLPQQLQHQINSLNLILDLTSDYNSCCSVGDDLLNDNSVPKIKNKA